MLRERGDGKMAVNGDEMTVQPRRNGPWIIAGMTFVIAAALALTVLLANDARHLKMLLAHYGLSHWLEPVQPPPSAQVGVEKEAPARAAPENEAGPAAFLFTTTGQTPFARALHLSPGKICDLMRAAGFEGVEWRASPGGSGLFECSGERLFSGVAQDEQSQPSLFAIVRGTEDERLALLRLKLVAPEGVEDTAVLKALDDFLVLLITETGWSDLEPVRARIARLESIREETAGFDLRFSREVTNEAAYNLILRPADGKPDARTLQKPARATPFNR